MTDRNKKNIWDRLSQTVNSETETRKVKKPHFLVFLLNQFGGILVVLGVATGLIAAMLWIYPLGPSKQSSRLSKVEVIKEDESNIQQNFKKSNTNPDARELISDSDTTARLLRLSNDVLKEREKVRTIRNQTGSHDESIIANRSAERLNKELDAPTSIPVQSGRSEMQEEIKELGSEAKQDKTSSKPISKVMQEDWFTSYLSTDLNPIQLKNEKPNTLHSVTLQSKRRIEKEITIGSTLHPNPGIEPSLYFSLIYLTNIEGLSLVGALGASYHHSAIHKNEEQYIEVQGQRSVLNYESSDSCFYILNLGLGINYRSSRIPRLSIDLLSELRYRDINSKLGRVWDSSGGSTIFRRDTRVSMNRFNLGLRGQLKYAITPRLSAGLSYRRDLFSWVRKNIDYTAFPEFYEINTDGLEVTQGDPYFSQLGIFISIKL